MVKLLLLLFLSTPVFAKTEKEIGLGSYSYHILGDAESFAKLEHKASTDGRLISNPMLSFKKTVTKGQYYTSDAFFAGNNSVATAMAGYVAATGAYVSRNLQLGFVYGVYAQDNREFIKRDIVNPFSIFQENKINIVPIFGAEINFKANITKKYFLKLNNVITPAVTNHTVSFGLEF